MGLSGSKEQEHLKLVKGERRKLSDVIPSKTEKDKNDRIMIYVRIDPYMHKDNKNEWYYDLRSRAQDNMRLSVPTSMNLTQLREYIELWCPVVKEEKHCFLMRRYAYGFLETVIDYTARLQNENRTFAQYPLRDDDYIYFVLLQHNGKDYDFSDYLVFN